MSSEGKVAFLFPGQGSQAAGMGKEAADNYEQAQHVFQTADDALGFSLSTMCFEGPDEDLKLTENTQPAILTTSVALYEVLSGAGVKPDYVAGHSLGEYSALVAAGALTLRDAVTVVRNRGRYMQEAVPVGVGAMAALLGLEVEAVEGVCRDAAENEVVQPANLNGGRQIVIAGHHAAVARACELAKQRGARRAVPLAVSAPFHCSLMAPAAERLKVDLESTDFSNLRVPLFTNVDAQPNEDGAVARDALVRQVASPVRWEEIVEAMASAGVRRFVEVGPGKVLSVLVKKIIKGAETFSVSSPDGIQQLQEASVV
jgi:[acyl-carrier-protein] S-malonyltransferase